MSKTAECFNGAFNERAGNGEFASRAGSAYFDSSSKVRVRGPLTSKTATVCRTNVPTSADCTVETDSATFEAMLEDPMVAMNAFMSGTLKADNLTLAMQLQQFLG